WRTAEKPSTHGVNTRFNAATAKRPWRTEEGDGKNFSTFRLQCGHGQEAVENLPITTGSPSYMKLQCGHGQEAVENEQVSGDLAAAEAASLRPRPRGRGELTPIRETRPPSRGFNAATAKRPWRTAAAAKAGLPSAQLQCGHGQEA